MGTIVNKGAILGKLYDPVSMNELQVFEAPYHETAVLLLRPHISVVEGGTMIYVLAPLKHKVVK